MKNFQVLFSLYGSNPVVIDCHDTYEEAIRTVIETNKIVKHSKSAKFEIIDRENNIVTHFETTERGISIYAVTNA